MRSLIVMNRINTIIRPVTSRYGFSCFQTPDVDQINGTDNERQDKDWDKKRFRYRRK